MFKRTLIAAVLGTTIFIGAEAFAITYPSGYYKTCTICPANATCTRNAAGDIGVRCNSGYALSKDGNKCEKATPKRCKEGSHESHDWIKKRYDNCTNCVVEKIPAGKCSKVSREHKHYYCTCDCK